MELHLTAEKNNGAWLQKSVETSLLTGCRQFVFMGETGDLQNRELFPDANVYVVIPANGSARPTLASASFHTVKLDREKDDLAAALLAYGYDMTQKASFRGWEGAGFMKKKKWKRSCGLLPSSQFAVRRF